MPAAVLGLHRTVPAFRPLVGSAGPAVPKIIADLVGADHAAWFQQFSTQDVLDQIRSGADFVYSGAAKTLQTLAQMGYRLALATASAKHTVAVVLAATGWVCRLAPIQPGRAEPAHKPAPEIYHEQQTCLPATPAIVVVQLHVGVAAAVRAGLPVVKLPGIGLRPDHCATAILAAITDYSAWLQNHPLFA